MSQCDTSIVPMFKLLQINVVNNGSTAIDCCNMDPIVKCQGKKITELHINDQYAAKSGAITKYLNLLADLQILNITNIGLVSVENLSLSLQQVYLSNNKLNHDLQFICNSPNIKILSIFNNRLISNIPTCLKNSKLQTIDIGKNLIQGGLENIPSSVVNLIASENRITILPPLSNKFNTVWLANNPLTEVTDTPYSFSNACSLKNSTVLPCSSATNNWITGKCQLDCVMKQPGSSSNKNGITIGLSVGGVLLIGLLGSGFYYCKRKNIKLFPRRKSMGFSYFKPAEKTAVIKSHTDISPRFGNKESFVEGSLQFDAPPLEREFKVRNRRTSYLSPASIQSPNEESLLVGSRLSRPTTPIEKLVSRISRPPSPCGKNSSIFESKSTIFSRLSNIPKSKSMHLSPSTASSTSSQSRSPSPITPRTPSIYGSRSTSPENGYFLNAPLEMTTIEDVDRMPSISSKMMSTHVNDDIRTMYTDESGFSSVYGPEKNETVYTDLTTSIRFTDADNFMNSMTTSTFDSPVTSQYNYPKTPKTKNFL